MAGMELQRRLEEAAYKEGRGKIPVQYYRDFAVGRASYLPNKPDTPENTNDNGDSSSDLPNTKGSYIGGNLKNVLPSYISDSIEEAMPVFGKTIEGFDSPDALMIGLESRTSSPVRITRNDDYESVSIKGIYPCGEGAGYAGGITSAAVDGIKVYEAIVRRITNL